MKKILSLALAWGALLACPAFAADQLAAGPTGSPQGDSQILSEIHHKNVVEIQLAELAKSRTEDKSVLGYADRLIQDHRKADQKTLEVASRDKLTIVTLPMSKEEADAQARLKTLHGTAFDEAFSQIMMKDHTQVISQLSAAENKAQNPNVKNLVASLLPTLHQHHDAAAQLNSQEKAAG